MQSLLSILSTRRTRTLWPLLWLGVACASSPEAKNPGAGPVSGGNLDAGESSPGDGDSAWDGGGQTGSRAPDGGEICADVHVTPARVVPSVVFLVDGSGSMTCVYPEDPACDCDAQVAKTCNAEGSVSRWQALSKVLVGAGAQKGLIEELEGAIRFGLTIYNDNPNRTECPGFPVQVAPGLGIASQIVAAFPAEPPGFNTPTGLALAALIENLPNASERDAQKLGPQRVVLATDGQPFACMDRDTLEKPALDYASVLTATDDAVAKGIDLYVMSLAPTSGAYAAHLSEVAQRGRTGAAFVPADDAELRNALREIIESAISCTLELAGEVENPAACAGTALLGDSQLACGTPDGFSIVDAKHVRLEGAACARFKREPGISLSMTFPCEGITLH